MKDFPLSDGTLFENRNALASALNMPRNQRRWVTDIAGTPSLHCLLPLFVELTAARVKLDDDWTPTSEWFHLAGEFMLQTVIEEYLRTGAYGTATFNAIFAFGCPGPRWAEEGADVTAMRRLFVDENNPRKEIPDWSNIKQQYIREVCCSAVLPTVLLMLYSFYPERPRNHGYKHFNRPRHDIRTSRLKSVCCPFSDISTEA
jgi:hypothetical protein